MACFGDKAKGLDHMVGEVGGADPVACGQHLGRDSHLIFGISHIGLSVRYEEAGYICSADSCRAGGDAVIPEVAEGEVVLFEFFFK